MSSMMPCQLQCPHCGNEQELEIWGSVNVKLDPELKEKLLGGEINVFACEKCGKRTFYDAPLLYHDMELHFCIQYIPPEELDDPSLFQRFALDGTLPVREDDPTRSLPDLQYVLRPHIVFDMGELLRYVAFRDAIAAASKR
jgi:hypothetical protein